MSKLRQHVQEYIGLITIAAIVIILDQLTKAWIHQNLAYGEVYRPELWLSNYARLVHVKNTGAAFGIFQNLGLVFTLLPFVISAVILYAFPKIPRQDWLIRFAMGLYLGGAIGNLIDRLTLGYVTDFISVGNFAIFNIADASLSSAAAIFILGVLIQEKRKQSEQKQPESTDPE